MQLTSQCHLFHYFFITCIPNCLQGLLKQNYSTTMQQITYQEEAHRVSNKISDKLNLEKLAIIPSRQIKISPTFFLRKFEKISVLTHEVSSTSKGKCSAKCSQQICLRKISSYFKNSLLMLADSPNSQVLDQAPSKHNKCLAAQTVVAMCRAQETKLQCSDSTDKSRFQHQDSADSLE